MPNDCFKILAAFLGLVLAGPGFVSSSFGQTAVIVNPDGSLTYLGTLGGKGTVASGINDAGQVVGW